MRRIAVAILFLLTAGDAFAVERHEIGGMSCDQVQALLKTEGVAILRYRSAFNLSLPLYDRYVSGQTECEPGEVALRTGVPTTDKDYCPVHKCVASSIFVAR